MNPFGRALLDYADGKSDAYITLERDDGFAEEVPVSVFFRDPDAFFPVEKAALELCFGRVLDIGAGTGIHSWALQSRGFSVTAVDVAPLAVQVMERRGVRDARCIDIFEMAPEPFDSVLLLCHGIGIVGSEEGLDRFLAHMKSFIAQEGQLLINSLDVGATDDPAHLAYHESNRKSGKIAGDIRVRIRYGELLSDWFSWIQFHPELLKAHAEAAGWRMETVVHEENGDYLARLTVSQSS